jgi:hypothetical protein
MIKNKHSKITLFFAAAALLFYPLFLVSCEKKGPMEKAGEKVDEGVEEVSDGIKDATN